MTQFVVGKGEGSDEDDSDDDEKPVHSSQLIDARRVEDRARQNSGTMPNITLDKHKRKVGLRGLYIYGTGSSGTAQDAGV